jgi:hypothetical protein
MPIETRTASEMSAFQGAEIMNHSIAVQEMIPFVEIGRVIVTMQGLAAVRRTSSIPMIPETNNRSKFHLTTVDSLSWVQLLHLHHLVHLSCMGITIRTNHNLRTGKILHRCRTRMVTNPLP